MQWCKLHNKTCKVSNWKASVRTAYLISGNQMMVRLAHEIHTARSQLFLSINDPAYLMQHLIEKWSLLRLSHQHLTITQTHFNRQNWVDLSLPSNSSKQFYNIDPDSDFSGLVVHLDVSFYDSGGNSRPFRLMLLSYNRYMSGWGSKNKNLSNEIFIIFLSFQVSGWECHRDVCL